MVEIFTRKDLYEKMRGFVPSSGEEGVCKLEVMRSFEKNGVALSDDKLQKIRGA